MLWAKSNSKSAKLDDEKRQEIANNVTSRLEQNKELKTVADNMAGLISKELRGIKNDAELRYAIGVATSQIRRYVANQVYQLVRSKQKDESET
jgi:transcriptional regulator NrdR family protein